MQDVQVSGKVLLSHSGVLDHDNIGRNKLLLYPAKRFLQLTKCTIKPIISM